MITTPTYQLVFSTWWYIRHVCSLFSTFVSYINLLHNILDALDWSFEWSTT